MIRIFLLLIFSSMILAFGAGAAEQKQDMGGWEIDSEYNKLYDYREMDSFKGWVIRVKEVVPMPGMSPGVAVDISETKDLKSEPIEVHLCPSWFADPKSIGIKRGDRVKVKGVWAEINGRDVFLASKIKKGDYFEFKVRLSKDGTPFWTMSPEQLKKERASSQASLKEK
ncbi:MAG: hypothetical protein JRH18_07095 [Deltaproteobacteria bacterium]|nr:hypothetical protein [Deltaproteobacteria bacterium]MBW1960433.1 hypothetical protein [Deltaproteobacteria bacterium]MBW2151419.1 hypothetical protein [Deltaproteobacteria bacterium]